MTVAATTPAVRSPWRPTPRRLARLVAGLWLFGVGEALIVHADLGNSPWTVLAQGLSLQTPLSVGGATIVLSLLVLAAWLPLRQLPGLGTVLNVLLVGVAIDVTLRLLPQAGALGWRAAMVLVGIALVAAGSGTYLTTDLGPGPRDGVMTGLHRRTGRSLRLWRTLLEGGALLTGFTLGGVAGFGTLAYALLIGPGVQAAVHRLRSRS
ncbi:MAG: hypothetical protein LT070_05675 [Solirubrobacteraceae bacterium]|nr:hypothetical protein [Solirubrobacteraceae bacterium]